MRSRRQATKVVAASTTPASIMPTRGTRTSLGRCTGRRRSSHRNRAEPTAALAAPAPILAVMLAEGARTVAARMPAVANCTVPVVEGATKRLRTSSCMRAPAVAMAAPARAAAAVRGIRDSTRSVVSWGPSLPRSSLTGFRVTTPVTRDRPTSTTRATRRRISTWESPREAVPATAGSCPGVAGRVGADGGTGPGPGDVAGTSSRAGVAGEEVMRRWLCRPRPPWRGRCGARRR